MASALPLTKVCAKRHTRRLDRERSFAEKETVSNDKSEKKGDVTSLEK